MPRYHCEGCPGEALADIAAAAVAATGGSARGRRELGPRSRNLAPRSRNLKPRDLSFRISASRDVDGLKERETKENMELGGAGREAPGAARARGHGSDQDLTRQPLEGSADIGNLLMSMSSFYHFDS